MLTGEEIEAIHDRCMKRVRIACDEYHGHSARRGCLHGDQDAIDTLKVIEDLRQLQGAVVQCRQDLDLAMNTDGSDRPSAASASLR